MKMFYLLTLVLTAAWSLAAMPSPARGQESPATMPATEPATEPATAPAVVAAPEPATRPVTRISINFKDASIDAVLEYLSDQAGFAVVKEQPVTGRVTMLSKQPVSPEEAVVLLDTALRVNGFTAIQMGRTLKVTTLDKAKKQNIPVFFGSDAAEIAPSDALRTQIIPIHSVDAVRLQKDIANLVNPDADLTSNPGSNTLMITDTAANVRRVVEIVSSLDKRESLESAIRVRQLKYADATTTAKLLTDIFNPQPQQGQGPAQGGPAQPLQNFIRNLVAGGGGGGGGFGRGGFGGGGGGRGTAAAAPSAGQDEAGQTGHLVAAADARTNSVVVSGPLDTLKVVDSVLDSLDANPAAEQDFFIYHVKNGQAVNMQNTLNSLFTLSSTGSNTSSLGVRTSYNSSTGNSVSGSSVFGANSNSNRGLGTGGTGLGNNNSQAVNRNTNTQAGAAANRPGGTGAAGIPGINDLVGQVFVVADQDTNSLLVATATKYEERVKAVILELDRPVPQVLIKCLIASVTHDNSSDLGTDFSIINLSPNGYGENIASNLGNAAAGIASGAGSGLTVALVERTISSTIHALAISGKLDVLSRPYILTSDNQQADINVGQEVPFITDTRTTDTGETINSVQYQNIGIILNVTPHINPDGLVVLDVSPQISSVSDQSVTIEQATSSSPAVTSPIFNNTSADARVAIRDGETIVIGGMMQDQKTQTDTKIPLLGDLPLLGNLFRRHQISKTKTELLIFLTPHVAQQPQSLQAMSNDEMKGVKLTPAAVEPGMFKEHIEGMHRGAASQPSPPPLFIPALPPQPKDDPYR